MHTYLKSKHEQLWTVGHYRTYGDGESSSEIWVPMKDFNTEDEAAGYASYLNGGEYDR